jgi:hypothetical protein
VIDFYTYCAFCVLQTVHRDLNKMKNMSDCGKFDTLILAYAKFYNPSENLAVDEVIVKFKSRVIFR